MKFGLVDGQKREATKGATGVCPVCDSELIARCGSFRIHHWAHKSIRDCDPWWETETEWHRSWKNNFPTDWQEIILHDERSGEKHIADVRTGHGLTIEFQHSRIDPQERISRERFYGNMVWVVNGTRLKGDYPRFLKGMAGFRDSDRPGVFLIDFPDRCFPKSWLGSSVPVIFDFRGTQTTDDRDGLSHYLYWLVPKRDEKLSRLVIVSREVFINQAISGELLRKKKVPQKTNAKQLIRGKESPYYYDQRKERFVKKRRL